MPTETESNLIQHAREELNRAGLFDKDADYGGETALAVMELIVVFSKQGHSGMSAELTLRLFDKVAHFQPLTPVTSDPAEWMEVEDMLLWQNRRQCSVFSHNAGRTWYDIDKPRTWRMRLHWRWMRLLYRLHVRRF